MPERVRRESPLVQFQAVGRGAGRAGETDLEIAERPFLGHLNLRGRPDDPGGEEFRRLDHRRPRLRRRGRARAGRASARGAQHGHGKPRGDRPLARTLRMARADPAGTGDRGRGGPTGEPPGRLLGRDRPERRPDRSPPSGPSRPGRLEPGLPPGPSPARLPSRPVRPDATRKGLRVGPRGGRLPILRPDRAPQLRRVRRPLARGRGPGIRLRASRSARYASRMRTNSEPALTEAFCCGAPEGSPPAPRSACS